MKNETRRGFTLVEISIVLIVIGLVAGAVMVGRDLIRQAELKKMHRQYEELVTAINTFRTKYNCLPGDCPQATELFGRYSGCPAPGGLLFSKTTFDPETCNGDGDGRIDAKSTMYEMLTLWQHLGNAGLIAGQYTGGATGGWLLAADVNCPLVATLTSRCWVAFDGDHSVWLNSLSIPPPVTIVPIHLGTIMVAGQSLGSGSTSGVFSPAEALGYDTKYDDGNPVSGNLLIAFGSQHCTTGDELISSPANATAQYIASDAAYANIATCNLVRRNAF